MSGSARFSATQPPAQALPIQIAGSDRPGDAHKGGNRISCNGCEAWWTGLVSAHCSACHESFTSAGGFDRHRGGGECRDPATLRTEAGEPVFVVANKPWPGWSLPGSWEGPDA